MHLLFCFLLLFPISSFASELKVTKFDYGNASEPDENPILPGENGAIFLTFQNPTNVSFRDLELSPYIGDCVDSFSTQTLRIPEIAANSSLRWNEPLEVKMSSACARENIGSFLLVGEHTNLDGKRQRIWAEVKFVVAPFPEVSFVRDNLNIPIPDKSTLIYDFEILSTKTIREIGVNVVLTHSAHRELSINLIHPSGTKVSLFSKAIGSGQLDLKLGILGIPHSELQKLAGLSAQGMWKLEIIDALRIDTGTFSKIGLLIR